MVLIFLPSANTGKKLSQIPSTIPTVLQSLNTSVTPSHFPNQQPSGVHTMPLMEFQAINLLTFPIVAKVISLVTVHQLLWVCIPLLCQVLNQPHCLQMFQVKNPLTSQAFIHYSLQLVFQVWFHLFKLVTTQPMFQVCTLAVDQVMALFVLLSCILSSTLVYHSHKPLMSLPVPISLPFSWNFHHSALLFILNQQPVVFQPMMLVL